MATDEVGDAIEKAEETLGKVDLKWGHDATAIVGVGYAILALVKTLKEVGKKE